MATGEGKTLGKSNNNEHESNQQLSDTANSLLTDCSLVSTLPVYLNALTGTTSFVVTVNDYLAKRDMEIMGQVHRYLGLTVEIGRAHV